MICPQCHEESDERDRFCAHCGASFRAPCPSCQAPLDPNANFCGQCGAVVSEVPEPRADAASDSPATEAERRQLTVLFSDLVGSTKLADGLDPEEWRSVVQAYQRVCTRAVESFGGTVAQYLGDGVLCYFGYPTASEHDAECALRAGLVMIE